MLVGAAIAIVELLVGNRFSEAELQQAVSGFGPVAPIAFLVLFVVLGAFIIPTTLLAVAAATIFGAGAGFVYSLLGAELAAILGFVAARVLGRDAVARWLGRHPGRLARLDKRLADRGFMTALIMRLVYLPNGLINVVCGISGMRLSVYSAATFLGILPMVFAVTFVTGIARTAILAGDIEALWDPMTITALAIFVACVTVPFASGLLRRRFRTRGLLTDPLDEISGAFDDEEHTGSAAQPPPESDAPPGSA